MFKAIITAAILAITVSAAAADQAGPNTSEKQTALIKCSEMLRFKRELVGNEWGDGTVFYNHWLGVKNNLDLGSIGNEEERDEAIKKIQLDILFDRLNAENYDSVMMECGELLKAYVMELAHELEANQ